MNEWIRCSDRLPEEPGEYLVFIKGAASATALLWDEESWLDSWETEYGEEITYQVTHWMPLPEPPKEAHAD